MKPIRIIIDEQPDIFDDWLDRFVSEQHFADMYGSISVRCESLHLTKRDHGTRRRYQLQRSDDTVVELERMPRNGRLEIRLARLMGAAPEKPLLRLDDELVTTNPADAGFCAGFCREINAVYEPDWFDLPRLSDLSDTRFTGRLNNLQIEELIYRLCALETLERKVTESAEPDLLRKMQEWLEEAQKGLPPFPDTELRFEVNAARNAPIKPEKGANREQWFLYYEECKRSGIKCTHKQLARECGISAGHFRTEYSKWKADRTPNTDTSNKNT